MTRAVPRSRTQPNAFARELFAGLPPRYDVLAEVLHILPRSEEGRAPSEEALHVAETRGLLGRARRTKHAAVAEQIRRAAVRN